MVVVTCVCLNDECMAALRDALPTLGGPCEGEESASGDSFDFDFGASLPRTVLGRFARAWRKDRTSSFVVRTW